MTVQDFIEHLLWATSPMRHWDAKMSSTQFLHACITFGWGRQTHKQSSEYIVMCHRMEHRQEVLASTHTNSSIRGRDDEGDSWGRGSLGREHLNIFLDQWEVQGWKSSAAKHYQQKEECGQKHGGEKGHANVIEWSHYVGMWTFYSFGKKLCYWNKHFPALLWLLISFSLSCFFFS